MINEDLNRDGDNDIDLHSDIDNEMPADFVKCPREDELENFPEVLDFIKRLQNFLHRQQSKLNKTLKKLKEVKSKITNVCDSATQTENESELEKEFLPIWDGSQGEQTDQSISEQVREAAQNAMNQTGFVYEERSGLYYDYNTGYYYYAELGLYYDDKSDFFYYYDGESKTFQFHSYGPMVLPYATPNDVINLNTESGHGNRDKCKSKRKEKEVIGSCTVDELTLGISNLTVIHTRKHALEVSNGWPPCLRIIVEDTDVEELNIGTLFVVTYNGGTLGSKNGVIAIRDRNISKQHAKFIFDESSGKYLIVDLGSQNGTYLDGKRLSAMNLESEPHEVKHRSLLQLGGTKLRCHVHVGTQTCKHCEPGLVQRKTAGIDVGKTNAQSKKYNHKKELKKMKSRFGFKSSSPFPVTSSSYLDRAKIRQTTIKSQVGNENAQGASVDNENAQGASVDNENPQGASLELPIQDDNIGFKLLSKMGWTKGQALGKTGEGCKEPVPVVVRSDRAGLGSTSSETPPIDPKIDRKIMNWYKAQKRYENIK